MLPHGRGDASLPGTFGPGKRPCRARQERGGFLAGLAAGAVDELDFWGGSFLLVLLGTIQAIVFAFVLVRKKSETVPLESEAFALLNEGATIKLPKVFRMIIQYVCPTALVVLLISWILHDGLNILLLRHIADDAMVQFFGISLSQKAFTQGFRLFLILSAVLVNVAIWYAWKSGRATGRDPKIKKVSIGQSEEDA